MKTLKGFIKSKKTLSDYLNIYDFVDEEIVDSHRGEVPPLVNMPTIMQCGEPYYMNRYTTFFKTSNGWQYVGELQNINKMFDSLDTVVKTEQDYMKAICFIAKKYRFSHKRLADIVVDSWRRSRKKVK